MDGMSHIDRAVTEKRPVPEIDFSLHTMEDGTQVSTQERVCKGMELHSRVNKHAIDQLQRRSSASLPPAI